MTSTAAPDQSAAPLNAAAPDHAGAPDQAAPRPRPYIVGLTGGIGSGKTTVADLLAERGATLVDTDQIAHELTGPDGAAMPQIREAFGDSVLAADGRLDRAAMRALAFSDPASRKRLESILHPLIRRVSEQRIASASGPYVVSVVPLLVEAGNWKGRIDRVLVVDCPEDVQIARVMRRSGLTREQVLAILAAQAGRAQRLAAADDVIDNAGGAAALVPQVDALHRRYVALAARQRTVPTGDTNDAPDAAHGTSAGS